MTSTLAVLLGLGLTAILPRLRASAALSLAGAQLDRLRLGVRMMPKRWIEARLAVWVTWYALPVRTISAVLPGGTSASGAAAMTGETDLAWRGFMGRWSRKAAGQGVPRARVQIESLHGLGRKVDTVEAQAEQCRCMQRNRPGQHAMVRGHEVAGALCAPQMAFELGPLGVMVAAGTGRDLVGTGWLDIAPRPLGGRGQQKRGRFGHAFGAGRNGYSVGWRSIRPA